MRGDSRLVIALAAMLALPGAAAAGAEDTTPTFTKDVAPIFQQKCQACHRAGYIAPMSLVTYAESRPWARSIKTRVETRQMPPWHLDKSVGIQDFQNDRSLTDAEIMRPNSGKLIKAGSSIVWDIHYHAVGEEITDTVELGLYRYPQGEKPKHRQVLSAFSTIEGGSDHLSIPPHQVTVTERFHVLKQNGRVENYQPHMHLRGKGMQMTAILPDGTTRVLSRVSDFNFNWHLNYVYADHAAPLLPKGTVLHLKSWYDNTSANRANPDPNQWVGYGDRTVDEMGHAWVNVTYLDDDDFAAALAEREALATTNDN